MPIKTTLSSFAAILPLFLLIWACENGGLTANGDHDDTAGGDADSDGDSDGDSDVDGDGDGDGDADGDGDEDTDGACVEANYEININPATIMVVMDRSASMHKLENQMDGQYYDEVLQPALKNVIESTQKFIAYGLVVFPSKDKNQDCELQSYKDACFGPNNNDLVDPKQDNLAEIDNALKINDVCGGTPTGKTLKWTREYLQNDLPDNLAKMPKFVLLATDGAPNCSADADFPCEQEECTNASDECTAAEQCLDDDGAYAEAAALAKDDVPVYVIGVGQELTSGPYTEVMSTIAAKGGTRDFYPADNVDSLNAAFDEIAEQTLEFTFNVEWDNVPDWSDGMTVDKACDKVVVYGIDKSGDETEIYYSADCAGETADKPAWHWKGWDEDPAPEDLAACHVVELCPLARKKLKSGDWETVSARFNCSPIIVESTQ